MALAEHLYPLQLSLQPSRCRRFLIVAAHALALLAVLLSATPVWLSIPMILAVLASALWQWRACGLHWALNWRADGRFSLIRGDENNGDWQLESQSCVWRWLVVLHLRDDRGRRLILPICFDQLPADRFRHLCVRLRLDSAQTR